MKPPIMITDEIAVYAIVVDSALQLTSNPPRSKNTIHFFICLMIFWFSRRYDNYFLMKVNINKKEKSEFIFLISLF